MCDPYIHTYIVRFPASASTRGGTVYYLNDMQIHDAKAQRRLLQEQRLEFHHDKTPDDKSFTTF
jgi:hypothetical protein